MQDGAAAVALHQSGEVLRRESEATAARQSTAVLCLMLVPIPRHSPSALRRERRRNGWMDGCREAAQSPLPTP
eukprot:scaffold241972_cov27-Tisochrysis_lutea.AAC.2